MNECLNNPCGQLCTNTDGSFDCSCMSGYALQDDGYDCEGNTMQKEFHIFMNYSLSDVNECFEAATTAENLCENDTNTRCVNTEGSFGCVCVSGYHRVDDTCQRKYKFRTHQLYSAAWPVNNTINVRY